MWLTTDENENATMKARHILKLTFLAVGVLLWMAVQVPSAAAQDCTPFQKAAAAALAASDDLDAQMARFKQTSSTPRYDAAVCSAARQLSEQASAAAALANATCDPKGTASALGELRASAEQEVPVFCTQEAPAAQETPAAAQATPTSGFIFPDSDRRLLTPDEVSRLPPAKLRIARNEIFARRGRYFATDDLKRYFNGFDWYHPNTWNPSLNAVEQQNVQIIENAERGR